MKANMTPETLTTEEMSALDEVIAERVAREKMRDLSDDFYAAESAGQHKARTVIDSILRSHGLEGPHIIALYCGPKMEKVGLLK